MKIETPAALSLREELPYRLKQQSLLAEFGRMAPQFADLPSLLQRASELCAEGLETRFCQVLEYQAGPDLLLMRAGTGWERGEVGHATLGADAGSPAGFAFHSGQSVLSNDLMAETRFGTPRLLADYGIQRAVNVLIDRGGRPETAFGVLEVDSPDPGRFDRGDVSFLAGCAGILGVAIERHQSDLRLQEALASQSLLTREMSHRVKNSLGVVAGLLRVNANTVSDPGAKSALGDAEARVLTIARVHDHLWRSGTSGQVDIGRFVADLCQNLEASTSGVTMDCRTDEAVVDADNAIPVGLIVNELVTNAIKYAYEPGQEGTIEVVLARDDDGITLSVTDRGKGLPQGFDLGARRKSFGMRVIGTLVNQLNGVMTIESAKPGSRFVIRFDPFIAADPASAVAAEAR